MSLSNKLLKKRNDIKEYSVWIIGFIVVPNRHCSKKIWDNKCMILKESEMVLRPQSLNSGLLRTSLQKNVYIVLGSKNMITYKTNSYYCSARPDHQLPCGSVQNLLNRLLGSTTLRWEARTECCQQVQLEEIMMLLGVHRIAYNLCLNNDTQVSQT